MMSLSPHHSQIITQWYSALRRHHTSHPSSMPSNLDLDSLITTSSPHRLLLGTGHQLTTTSFLPHILNASHEILLVTCFWARSPSQAALSSTLKALSARALTEHRRIRVRVCLSSLSLWQKLTQTSSPAGKTWPPSTWEGKLGLPPPGELRGLDLVVKSVFVRPFSVMHSKFLVVDREMLCVPSCNVSWEEWGEGCVEMRGAVVGQIVRWWEGFWGIGEMEARVERPEWGSTRGSLESTTASESRVLLDHAIRTAADVRVSASPEPPYITLLAPLAHVPVPTLLLPSPHHRSPHFRPFTTSLSSPPPTPLNLFLLTAFTAAKESIYILTPNITSPPVLAALLSALERGVDVTIISNMRMMVAEQLVTAGTITECSLASLHCKYQKLRKKRQKPQHPSQNRAPADAETDIELAPSQPGSLDIYYYVPPTISAPRKTHIKLTILDRAIVVLGSGNMDRASWYTSQELGIAFFSEAMARVVRDGVDVVLDASLRKFGGEK